MSPFVLFEVKAALIIAAFHLGYRLLLSREKLLGFNRTVLLATLCASFLLPLCRITFHKTVPLPAEGQAAGLTEMYAEILESGGAISTGAHTSATVFPWEDMLTAIYFTGTAAMLLKIILDTAGIIRTIKSGRRIPQNDGTEIIVLDNGISPFSWMKWIFISEDDYSSGNSHILMHERAHIRLGHAKDMLLYNILLAFQWFNPAMWLLGRDLRSLCEYEADNEVLKNGTDIKEYQYSLIRKAAGASGNSITNSFNHSILKNRITMMSKSKSPMYRGLRVLYIIPLTAAVLTANAETKIDYKISENPAMSGAIAEEKDENVLVEIKKENGAFAIFVNGNVSTENISTALTNVIDSDGSINVTIQAEDDTPMGIIADIKSVLRLFPVKIRYTGESQESYTPGQVKLPEALISEVSLNPDTGISPDKSISKRNIVVFFANKNGKYFIHTEPRELDAETRNYLKKVISNEENSTDNPETVMTEIRRPDGSTFSYPVSKASIVFRCDRKTPYKYFRESNEFLKSVYAELRNECSEKVFGKSLSNLSEAEYRTIVTAIPMLIMEADMMDR